MFTPRGDEIRVTPAVSRVHVFPGQLPGISLPSYRKESSFSTVPMFVPSLSGQMFRFPVRNGTKKARFHKAFPQSVSTKRFHTASSLPHSPLSHRSPTLDSALKVTFMAPPPPPLLLLLLLLLLGPAAPALDTTGVALPAVAPLPSSVFAGSAITV